MKLQNPAGAYRRNDELERNRQIEQADDENHKRNRDVEIGSARLILTDANGIRWEVYVDESGYLQTVQIGDDDVSDWTRDAFGRMRVSDTGQRLDVEFLFDKQIEYFDETTSNGTVTHNAASRDLTLSISNATNGTHATMRSHPIPYTPGNSQLIEMTGALDLAAIGGGTAQVFLRSKVTGSVVETVTDQADWSNATTGVDWTDSHIFAIDFQSLKTGRIRYGLVQAGAVVQVHEIINDNIRDTGYWQMGSLPSYWRIYNDATYTYMEVGYGDEDNAVGFRYRIAANATATMRAICCTVKSEAGTDLAGMEGLPRCADNGTTVVSVGTTLIPILSIRPRTTFNSLDNLLIGLPKAFTVETDNPIKIVGVIGGTLTGASWADVDTSGSMMEMDVTATAISGGRNVFAGYASSAGKNTATSGQGLLGKTVLWDRQSSETGVLTIAAVRTGGTSADVLAALQWDEIR